jgi:hypothetical protein
MPLKAGRTTNDPKERVLEDMDFRNRQLSLGRTKRRKIANFSTVIAHIL